MTMRVASHRPKGRPFSEDDPLLRVVAIAVQGMMSRSPKRPFVVDDILALLGLGTWWLSALERGFDIDLPFHDGNTTYVKTYLYSRGEGAADKTWSASKYKDGAMTRVPISQEEMERIAAVAFTFPYAVERVGDVAIAFAKERIRHAATTGP